MDNQQLPTLKEFQGSQPNHNDEQFVALMGQIEEIAKKIQHKRARVGLIEESGKTGTTNVYGDKVEKLDAWADKMISDLLLKGEIQLVHMVGSEELEEPLTADHDKGVFNVCHDPLDGSSNIDFNISVGTIFSIYPRSDSILQPGSKQIAAGYIMYGASTMIVYTTGNGVNGFTLNPDTGEFVLIYENITIPEAAIYSINEGNATKFNEGETNYLKAIKEDGKHKLRYIGSMVADVHRTLLKGGIFIYPSDKKNENGKLRLLFEVSPMSMIIEQAGGLATAGGKNPLEIVPEKVDQRVPIALGSKGEVEKYLTFSEVGTDN